MTMRGDAQAVPAGQPEEIHNSFEGPLGHLNWRAYEAGQPHAYAFEFPLYSDGDFVGELRDGVGPYQVLHMRDWAVRSGSARAALTVRVDLHVDNNADHITRRLTELAREQEAARQTGDSEKSSKKSKRSYTDASRFHGGELRDEMAALLSLTLGARLQAGAITREFYADDPRGMPIAERLHGFLPLHVSESRPVLPRALHTHVLKSELLSTYPSLSAVDATVLLRAARSYQAALWVAEMDPSLAWLLLVSAVETAASQWFPQSGDGPLSEVEMLAVSRPKLVSMMREHAGEALVEAAAKELAPIIGSTRKFVNFLLTFLPDAPTPRPDHLALEWSRDGLKKPLQLVYGYRSKALHESTPIPPPMCEPPFPLTEPTGGWPEGRSALAEVPWKTMSYQKGGFWSGDEMPMVLSTFEYIVRNALLKWWLWLSERAGIRPV